MNTNDLRKQKTAYYRWQKSRLEALLAVVQRKEEIINIILKSQNLAEAKKSISSRFNLSSKQVNFLLNYELRKFGALKYEELQKEYEKILRYCQILAPNKKNYKFVETKLKK